LARNARFLLLVVAGTGEAGVLFADPCNALPAGLSAAVPGSRPRYSGLRSKVNAAPL
jgi:hypothetical protein